MNFSVGIDANAIQFADPTAFKDSEYEAERKIHEFASLAQRR